MKTTVLAGCICLLAAGGARAAAPEARRKRTTPVVEACRKARPAIVNISTKKMASVRFGLFGDRRFDDIFPSPLVRRVPVQSLGSGVVLHSSGYVVTNAHVVRRAQEISVTLHDKTRHTAKVISADPTYDLAVLKIDLSGGGRLAYLPLGRSDDLMVGETVIAVGNPLGLASTVTTGVISATDRTLEFSDDVKYHGLIQTDAPINPGNSGGPLLNICGELIGINTAIRPEAQNIGFAIPVDLLTRELAKLLDFERINRVVFGAEVVQSRRADGADELKVMAVRPGTPAAGKLRVGDRLAVLNGLPVRQIPDYTCGMLAVKPDEDVRLVVRRKSGPETVVVRMQAKGPPDGKALANKLFGMTLREVTPELARDLSLPVRSGLLVVGLDAAGPAQRIGLRLKDVLFQVDRFYVKDLPGLGMILEEVRPGQSVKIGIVRGNVRAWASIRARTPPPGKGPT